MDAVAFNMAKRSIQSDLAEWASGCRTVSRVRSW